MCVAVNMDYSGLSVAFQEEDGIFLVTATVAVVAATVVRWHDNAATAVQTSRLKLCRAPPRLYM